MAKQKSMMDYMKARTSMQLKRDDDNPKRPKNYNYKAAEAQELEGSAIGKVGPKKQKEIEQSFKEKRKEWSKAYSKGEMSKSALKDSIASTLGPKSKVRDYMPVKVKIPKVKVKAKLEAGNNPFW